MPSLLRLFVCLLMQRLLGGLRYQRHLHLLTLSATTWPRYKRGPMHNPATTPGVLPAQYVCTAEFVVIYRVSAGDASQMNHVVIPPLRDTMFPNVTPTFRNPIYSRYLARPRLRCLKACLGRLGDPVVVLRHHSAVLHLPYVLPSILSPTIRKTIEAAVLGGKTACSRAVTIPPAQPAYLLSLCGKCFRPRACEPVANYASLSEKCKLRMLARSYVARATARFTRPDSVPLVSLTEFAIKSPLLCFRQALIRSY